MSDHALDNTTSNTITGTQEEISATDFNSSAGSESAQEAARIMGLSEDDSDANFSKTAAPDPATTPFFNSNIHPIPGAVNGNVPNAGAPATPASSTVAPIVDQAKQQAQKVIEHTQRTAGQAIGKARTTTASWIETQLDTAADNLNNLAGAVRDTGAQMRTNDPTHLAQVADLASGAADAVENVSTRLRDATVDDLVVETSQLARQQPALFIGGAFALGFLLARFLKSTSSSGSAGFSNNSFSGSSDRLLPVPMDQEPQAGV